MLALQLAICVSSRVNDSRTAQQLGVFVILPIPALMVGQLLGTMQLTTPNVAMTLAPGLANAGMMWVAICCPTAKRS